MLVEHKITLSKVVNDFSSKNVDLEFSYLQEDKISIDARRPLI